MKEFRFGICAKPDQIALAAQAGYDYVELNLNDVLGMNEDEYRAMAADMEKHNIYAEVVCGMLPDGVQLVGEGVRSQEIHQALDLTFDMAQALGAELVIFDCEKSRMLPHGFDPAMAWRQLGNFIRILQSYAANFDVKTALLPLRRSAAELMNYVTEATLISAILRLDRVGVAASLFNMAMEAESLPQLKRTGSLLWHMRTSNVLGNRPPRTGDGEDYASLFAALREMGYTGRITMEAPCADFARDAAEALLRLKEAAQ
ncbi:MAG: sugar phosphate isomerase/epimerase [Clostridia bacterium]|nr:sugar phosphate isomerase/epimerase [Clostridia bacterium]